MSQGGHAEDKTRLYAPILEQDVNRNRNATSTRLRVQMDGKFFARGARRLRVSGVTYGPFTPDASGHTFPPSDRVNDDFARMKAANINAIRTYFPPPDWFLHLADDNELTVLAGVPWAEVPWRRHLEFLGSRRAREDARRLVRSAAVRGRDHPCTLAYCLGNEFPPDILRWHDVRRVEHFLTELADVCKQADPEGLVTYASYPPTEYLDLSCLDFITFNVYLHDPETFRRYLLRLQHMVGDQPLLLGELGLDTIRHGEENQAHFLARHLREAVLTGLAGAFVFSWTDDWHNGGHPIHDWAFGITRADRTPKPAYFAASKVFGRSPVVLLPRLPRVTVIVCSYNGGRTLEQCIRSLGELAYPDYEVIVVDDGSTDGTHELLANFPGVRAIHQPHRGLSAARNTGLYAATGEIVTYTDSDCFVDPDWLSLLIHQLLRSGADAVGGPNLSPEDGWLAACVAASPGQPTHVLQNDEVAEHIPGCNMAFRREALLAINGFDPVYRKAGDDVDVCWRLQQTGRWITFASGAFVWHHRRQGPFTYLRQQAGYGEAEALLSFQHPDRFNWRGDSKWHGKLYGVALQGLHLGKAIIYRGTFSTGHFQCIYRPAPAHWALLPSTLEWHVGAILVGGLGLFWPMALTASAVMFALSLGLAILRARQARLTQVHDSLRARCLIAALYYLQPLVRSWTRYRARLWTSRSLGAQPGHLAYRRERLSLRGRYTATYWSGNRIDRTELLSWLIRYLNDRGWENMVDSGWSDKDLRIYCHHFAVVDVCTAQQDYSHHERVICVRCQVRPSGPLLGALVLTVLAGIASFPAGAWLATTVVSGLGFFIGGLWLRAVCQASCVMACIDALAEGLGLVRSELAPGIGKEVGGESSPRSARIPMGTVSARLLERCAILRYLRKPVDALRSWYYRRRARRQQDDEQNIYPLW